MEKRDNLAIKDENLNKVTGGNNTVDGHESVYGNGTINKEKTYAMRSSDGDNFYEYGYLDLGTRVQIDDTLTIAKMGNSQFCKLTLSNGDTNIYVSAIYVTKD